MHDDHDLTTVDSRDYEHGGADIELTAEHVNFDHGFALNNVAPAHCDDWSGLDGPTADRFVPRDVF